MPSSPIYPDSQVNNNIIDLLKAEGRCLFITSYLASSMALREAFSSGAGTLISGAGVLIGAATAVFGAPIGLTPLGIAVGSGSFLPFAYFGGKFLEAAKDIKNPYPILAKGIGLNENNQDHLDLLKTVTNAIQAVAESKAETVFEKNARKFNNFLSSSNQKTEATALKEKEEKAYNAAQTIIDQFCQSAELSPDEFCKVTSHLLDLANNPSLIKKSKEANPLHKDNSLTQKLTLKEIAGLDFSNTEEPAKDDSDEPLKTPTPQKPLTPRESAEKIPSGITSPRLSKTTQITSEEKRSLNATLSH